MWYIITAMTLNAWSPSICSLYLLLNGLGSTVWLALDSGVLDVLNKEIWKHFEHQNVFSFTMWNSSTIRAA